MYFFLRPTRGYQTETKERKQEEEEGRTGGVLLASAGTKKYQNKRKKTENIRKKKLMHAFPRTEEITKIETRDKEMMITS